jgi:glycosyltransferase involved in cell wall biosynthesis
MTPRFVAAGVRFDVVYLTDRPGLHDTLRQSGAEVHGIFGRRPQQVRDLHRLLRQRRPDLVHTTLAGANAVGRAAATLARVPVVTSLVNVSYGPEYLNDPQLKAWKVRALHGYDAATAWRVRRFHALTPHVAEVMARRLLVPRSRIDVIPRGRDRKLLGQPNPQRRSAVRQKLGLDRDQFVVLAAARHEWQKGLDVLVGSMPAIRARHADARLLLAGREGNQTAALHAAVDDLGLTDVVTFLGSRDDVPDLMCAADTLVVPSRWEGLGSVLIEAMALYTPIVASDVPPIRQTADETCALLVPPADSSALAGAILDVVAGRERTRARVVTAAERFGQRYELDEVCRQMLAFYERALSR